VEIGSVPEDAVELARMSAELQTVVSRFRY
jgi:hypothetical protein